MKFLCDRMLVRLGRWMRAAGYDTLIADGEAEDRALLDRAVEEERLLLTCDRRLAERRLAQGRVVILAGGGVPRQVEELAGRVRIDWLHDPFTRCILDNTPLRDATAAERGKLPAGIRALDGRFAACPSCERVFWEGSHHRRMRRRLESWHRDAVRPR